MHLTARTDSGKDPLVQQLCMSPLDRRAMIPARCGVGNGGMGVIPLIALLPIAGAAAYASWKTFQENFGDAFTRTPSPANLPGRPPPVAPVTRGEATIPGAFTPEEVFQRTRNIQQAEVRGFRSGAQSLGPTQPEGSSSPDYLLYIMLGIGGLALISVTR